MHFFARPCLSSSPLRHIDRDLDGGHPLSDFWQGGSTLRLLRLLVRLLPDHVAEIATSPEKNALFLPPLRRDQTDTARLNSRQQFALLENLADFRCPPPPSSQISSTPPLGPSISRPCGLVRSRFQAGRHCGPRHPEASRVSRGLPTTPQRN